MNERQYELYRLSQVEQMPDSPLKDALMQAIRHKLTMLDQYERSTKARAANA